MDDWHEEGAPVDAALLAATERAIGVALPAPLRAFWARHNGGWPEDDEPHPLGVHGYVPLGDGPTCAVALHGDLVEANPDFAGLIPFAYDAGGNTFLAPRAGSVGRPVLWLHQEGAAVALDHPLEALLPPDAC